MLARRLRIPWPFHVRRISVFRLQHKLCFFNNDPLAGHLGTQSLFLVIIQGWNESMQSIERRFPIGGLIRDEKTNFD